MHTSKARQLQEFSSISERRVVVVADVVVVVVVVVVAVAASCPCAMTMMMMTTTHLFLSLKIVLVDFAFFQDSKWRVVPLPVPNRGAKEGGLETALLSLLC